jgi:hypothetical protein
MKLEEEKERLIIELYRPARKNFLRRKVIQKGINDTWQIDLIDMKAQSRENKGFTFILTVICIFSKFAYVRPLKNKTGKETAKALRSIFRLGKTPKKIHSDDGNEFRAQEVKNLFKEYNIEWYSTYSNLKASVSLHF